MSNLPNRMPPVPNNPIADRISAKQAEINKPMACEKCGSTYFFELDANQWAGGGFGTVEFRLLSISSVRVKVCLCGHIVPPTPQATQYSARATGHLDFPESAARAVEFREKNGVQGLVQVAASRSELEQVKGQLEALKSDVEEKLNNVNGHIADLDNRTISSVKIGPGRIEPHYDDMVSKVTESLTPAPATEQAQPQPQEGQILTSTGKTKGRQKK